MIENKAVSKAVVAALKMGLTLAELSELSEHSDDLLQCCTDQRERFVLGFGLHLLAQLPQPTRLELCVSVYQALFDNVELYRAHNYRINEMAIIPASRPPEVVYVLDRTAFYSNIQSMQQFAAQTGAGLILAKSAVQTRQVLRKLGALGYFNTAIEFPGKDVSAMLGGPARSQSAEFHKRTCFVLGNESFGVDPGVLNSPDLHAQLQLPQCGPTVSYNVVDAMLFGSALYKHLGEKIFYETAAPSGVNYQVQSPLPIGTPPVAYTLEFETKDDAVITQLPVSGNKNMMNTLRQRPATDACQLFTVRPLLHYAPIQIFIGVYVPASIRKNERIALRRLSAFMRTFVTFQYMIAKVFLVKKEGQPEHLRRSADRVLAKGPSLSPAYPFPEFFDAVSGAEFMCLVKTFGLLLTNVMCAEQRGLAPPGDFKVDCVASLASAGRHVFFFHESNESPISTCSDDPGARLLRSGHNIKNTMVQLLTGLAVQQPPPPQDDELISRHSIVTPGAD